MSNGSPERFFEKFPHMVTVASHRQDGNMKVASGMNGKETAKNREDFIKRLFPDLDIKAVVADINHGTRIRFIQSLSSPTVKNIDGLIAKGKYNLPLAVTFADCSPLFLFDPAEDIIAIGHCSYHNVAKNFPLILVKKMLALGSHRRSIQAAIGPGISVCCYEFDLTDAEKNFGLYDSFILESKIPGKCMLDLRGIVKRQLESAGVENIEISPDCTCCSKDVYFSARGEKMKLGEIKAGLAVIGIRKIRNYPA